MNDFPPFRNRGGTFVYPEVHHGGPSSLAWTIFALEILLLVGLGALLASTVARGRRRPAIAGAPAAPPAGRDDPLEVIRMRYARGELTRDDYLQARRDLGGATADEAPTEELPEG